VENKILHGDSLELLKDLDDNSVDSVVTDPPYGYSFMGKDWDKALPSIDIWKESVRVLKPGGFAFIMSAPRSDVHSRMCLMLEEAGFRIDFTPIAWTYATGFPKASNIGKMVDKRLGKERKVIGKYKTPGGGQELSTYNNWKDGEDQERRTPDITEPSSDKAKELDGSYGGFQPKPAWENVIVCMKPLSEKGYLDQAMKNGKGVTWLDDCRVPFQSDGDKNSAGFWGITKQQQSNALRKHLEDHKGYDDGSFVGSLGDEEQVFANPQGRFPANLLVQDDVLNNGKDRKAGKYKGDGSKSGGIWHPSTGEPAGREYGDEGSFSRYYDLDAWWRERIKELPLNVQATYPFMIVPKAGKKEKNKGCEGLEEKPREKHHIDQLGYDGESWIDRKDGKGKVPIKHTKGRYLPQKNNHPTVKPISLMSYLVTLSSREGELVLDPFVGSGTTCIAAKLLNRKYIGMEMDDEYVVIAQERIKAHEPEQKQHDFF